MAYLDLNKRRTRSMVLSVLLHVLLFLLWWGIHELKLLASPDLESVIEPDPIVFELESPRRTPEVVETPEDARTDQIQDADLASDKNARAQNPETDPNLEVGDAFSPGEFDVRELPTNQMPEGESGLPAEQAQKSENREEAAEKVDESESGDLHAAAQNEKFSREALIRSPSTDNPGAESNRPKPLRDNRLTQAIYQGAFSFSTYDWDFAPYMLRLKKKVEGNIFPPPAFVRMGLISGETFLRFKIYPNGELKDLELIEYQGHESLMRTSMEAIEVSVPFEKLPKDFPEDYLEVTAKFGYYVQ